MARPSRPLVLALGLALLAGCEDPPRAQAPTIAALPTATVTASPAATPAQTPAPATTPSATAAPASAAPASVTPASIRPVATPSAAIATPTPTPTPASTPTPPLAVPAGLIVPMYLHDGDPGWGALVAVKRAHPSVPMLAILNPADGVTRDRVPAIAEAVERLEEAGVVTLGYVRTNYAARSENAIALELDRWRSQYPTVKGIFFDEMSSAADSYPYYGALSYAAKRRGFTLAVGNVGVAPEDGLFAAMDVLVVYEDAGLPPDAATARREHIAMLAHSVGALDPAAVRQAARRYGYLYVTDDALPNPWDTLSRYAEALAELLSGA